ncbi:MAG: protein kinase [Lachnospiraceae bacterium]|nr:protein kinase [Lachnospiraceae bacterium]
MLKPGTLLCDRYKVLEEIGSGGMSNVYKSQDMKLNRYVAVKVLKPEFSRDRNFVTKFRIEAQASAGLSHPNIVNVYDVVEEDGMYFIVMEFVDGITLKEYIEENGRLSMDKALDVSIQIAAGLEEAHEHHIIHRDIKPQNIIVSRNGNIKVTDFGIAKAATSNTLTSGQMGSVHYISPEQARGGYSDEKSDIYSLGITMYEMVTGRVPFEGENNVSVALMHIQNEIIPPRQYYPDDIYSSFEKIILKATQKKPERRYLTASALIADLKRVQNNPNIDAVGATNNQSPKNGNTKEFTKEDMEEIRNKSQVKPSYIPEQPIVNNNVRHPDQPVSSFSNEMEELTPVGTNSTPQVDNSRLEELMNEEDSWERELAEEEEYEARREEERRAEAQRRRNSIKKVPDYEDDGYAPARRRDDDDDEGGIDPNLKLAVTIAGVATALIIMIILFVIIGNTTGLFKFGGGSDNKTTTETTASQEGISTEKVETFEMIDVVGDREDGAKKRLEQAGFTNVTFVHVKDDKTQEGYVISQNYEEGRKIPADSDIEIKVSAGVEEIPVPDVTGQADDRAVTILTEAGFHPIHGYEFSETVEKDKVIKTVPAAGSMLGKGQDITVVVSNGSEKKEVSAPKLAGLTEVQARNKLSEVKLNTGSVSHQYSDSVTEGLVISQSIPEGTNMDEGSAIDFVISDGPEPKPITYTASIAGDITLNDESLDGTAVSVRVIFNGNVVASRDVTVTSGGTYSISASVPELSEQSGSADFEIVDANGANVTGAFTKGEIGVTFAEDAQ